MKALTIVSSVVFLHVFAFVVLVNGCSTRVTRERNKQEQFAPVSGTSSVVSSEDNTAPTLGTAVEEVPAEPIEPEEPAPVEEEVKPAPAEENTTVYVVKQNDSLWLIAKKHKTTVNAICKENGINKNAILRAGTKLKIPAGAQEPASEKTSAAKTDGTTYVVKKGDALSKIARRNGVSVKALKEANNLTSDNIRIGQKLVIPAKDAPAKKAEAKPAPEPKTESAVVPEPQPVEPEEPEFEVPSEPVV